MKVGAQLTVRSSSLLVDRTSRPLSAVVLSLPSFVVVVLAAIVRVVVAVGFHSHLHFFFRPPPQTFAIPARPMRTALCSLCLRLRDVPPLPTWCWWVVLVVVLVLVLVLVVLVVLVLVLVLVLVVVVVVGVDWEDTCH